MGACQSKTNLPETAVPWPDLPPEIAGLIFCHIPSHNDRLSFSAVCRKWRLFARQQSPLPPARPCMILGRRGGSYQSLIDGKVRRFTTPEGYRIRASFGGWLLYYHKGSGRCFLHAPFSGFAIKVPIHYRKFYIDDVTEMAWAFGALPNDIFIGRRLDMKIVVCSSSSVVVLCRHPGAGDFRPVSYLASFRPGLLHQPWTVCSFVIQSNDHHPAYLYTDIAFYRGKIFALSWREKLFCHDVEGGKNHHLQQQQQPTVEHVKEARPAKFTNSYLVVSSDQKRLLMVRWRRRSISAIDVRVFQADFTTGRWSEVKDLGDQILFLGRNSSMAFLAGSTKHWGPRFCGGNRVFVLGSEWAGSSKRDIPGYCVYDMASGETSLVSRKAASYMGSCTSGWFSPHD